MIRQDATQVLPHQLLDDGHAPPSCEVLVVGCGNMLRGDDAVGPRLIRRLWENGIPDTARMVDGGTAGMDVAFQMQGARRVVIVDAASTGAEPGTIFRVPGEELAQLPPVDGVHTHSFRWDHALAFAHWLLGPKCPTDVTVFLIEAGQLEPGADLSAPVLKSMQDVEALIRVEFLENARHEVSSEIELTTTGYLHMSAAFAGRHFPADVCAASVRDEELLLHPIHSQANGGHLLKLRNAVGDRSMLVRELLGDRALVGTYPAVWDEARGCVVIGIGRQPP
jgi:hydrogenase maturation protease